MALGSGSLLIVLRMSVFYASAKFPLIEPSSFAIWHRNKAIVGIAAGLWGVNFALLFAGEFFPA
jgi:hypothetical protein